MYFQDRIDRNCISCEPKPVDGIQVGGLLYHISSEKNPSFFIGKKEIPLKLYKKYETNSYEIIQVDPDGTAWIDNFISCIAIFCSVMVRPKLNKKLIRL